MKKGLRWVTVITATFGFGAILTVSRLLPVITVRPLRTIAREALWRFPKGIEPSSFGLQGQPLQVTTSDGITIQALAIPAIGRARATLILLHGRTNCKESQLERAQWLANLGFNCVLMDLRAHGESTGEYCTYGYYEKHDVQALIDCLPAPFYHVPIGIWGLSLGGAIALQSIVIDSRIQFGIIESTFDELPNVVMEYGADYMLGLRSSWLTNIILAKSAEIACFEPQAVRPVVAASFATVPMLFIHGDSDDKIPSSFNEKNYHAVPHKNKSWVMVKGAGHHDVWEKGGVKLKEQIGYFLFRNSQ